MGVIEEKLTDKIFIEAVVKFFVVIGADLAFLLALVLLPFLSLSWGRFFRAPTGLLFPEMIFGDAAFRRLTLNRHLHDTQHKGPIATLSITTLPLC